MTRRRGGKGTGRSDSSSNRSRHNQRNKGYAQNKNKNASFALSPGETLAGAVALLAVTVLVAYLIWRELHRAKANVSTTTASAATTTASATITTTGGDNGDGTGSSDDSGGTLGIVLGVIAIVIAVVGGGIWFLWSRRSPSATPEKAGGTSNGNSGQNTKGGGSVRDWWFGKKVTQYPTVDTNPMGKNQQETARQQLNAQKLTLAQEIEREFGSMEHQSIWELSHALKSLTNTMNEGKPLTEETVSATTDHSDQANALLNLFGKLVGVTVHGKKPTKKGWIEKLEKIETVTKQQAKEIGERMWNLKTAFDANQEAFAARTEAASPGATVVFLKRTGK
jgi:hypothetical protein